MKHRHLTGLALAAALGALVLLVPGGAAVGATNSDSGLITAEALASGQCEDGDLPCLAELTAGSDDGSSDDGKSGDGKSDDKGSKDDDSKSRDGKSDDTGSEDDDSESRDGKSDDKGSKDDDSKSRDGKSDDKGSKDDDSESRDGKSDDTGSEDDDSKSRDDKSDDKGSEDDDSKSDDGSSDDSDSDEDSMSDDDSSSDDGPVALPEISIGNGEGAEFNNITQVPVNLNITLSAASADFVTVNWATENGTAVAGTDFIADSGQETLAPDELTLSITVFIIGDDVSEPTESFFVRLSMPSGATVTGVPGEVLIFDDDDIDD